MCSAILSLITSQYGKVSEGLVISREGDIINKWQKTTQNEKMTFVDNFNQLRHSHPPLARYLTWYLHSSPLYPGLLTPAFVACSTNAGEGPENCSALPIANMGHRMTERSSSDNLLELRKPLYSCTEERCRISTCSGMSLHMTQFYQAFSCLDTASDKC